MSSAQKIIIDCDPGVDDAVAILLALASPKEIDLLAVTCVVGNVALEQTFKNARRLCAWAKRPNLPVLAGCSRPIMGSFTHKSSVHGDDGLGDVDIPYLDDAPLTAAHAVDFILDEVRRNPNEITLCVIGPMTNIALTIAKDPQTMRQVKEIIFMGGAAFTAGNVNPCAEFNIFVDPHAAHIVFGSGIRLTMFGLDATRHAIVPQQFLANLSVSDAPFAKMAAAMMSAYVKSDRLLHDPCVIAHIIDPEIFRGSEVYLEVVTQPGPTFGQTVAYEGRHLKDRATNAYLITHVDTARLFNVLESRLSN